MSFWDRRTDGETLAVRQRRELEDKRTTLLKANQDQFKSTHAAKWEQSSQKLVDETNVKRYALKLRQEAAAALESRKQKLAELLAKEEALFRQEIVATAETVAQRNARLMAHAKQFKDIREEKRVQYAQEQYMRLWRNGCDDLRTLDSEAFNEYIKAEQLKQKHERRAQQESLKQDEERWARLWEEDRRQKLKREEEESYKRGVVTADNRNMILKQIALKQEKREEEELIAAEEREMWKAQMAHDAEIARKNQQAELDEKRRLGQEVMQFNEEFLARKKREWEERREAERKEMLTKLAKFEKDEMLSRSNIHAMQMEMQSYRNYLMERREKEKALERELERLTKLHLDKANAKQDETWRRERLAREKLMQEVFNARNEQVQQKEAYRLRTEKERQQERELLAHDLEIARQKDEREELDRYEAGLKRKADLEKKMQAKANMKALEAAAIAQEEAAAAIAEQQYRDFVRREQGRHRQNHEQAAASRH
jgi:trichoplein keratin filament-binding protein